MIDSAVTHSRLTAGALFGSTIISTRATNIGQMIYRMLKIYFATFKHLWLKNEEFMSSWSAVKSSLLAQLSYSISVHKVL